MCEVQALSVVEPDLATIIKAWPNLSSEIATEGGTGLLDLQGGTLVINADARDVVTEFINLGKIVGYGGANAVSVTYNGNGSVTGNRALVMMSPS